MFEIVNAQELADQSVKRPLKKDGVNYTYIKVDNATLKEIKRIAWKEQNSKMNPANNELTLKIVAQLAEDARIAYDTASRIEP